MTVRRLGKLDLQYVHYILANLIDPSNKRPPATKFDHWENLLSDERTYLLAALQDNIAVGYTLAYRFPSLYAPENMAYLYDIEVAQPHRRQGIGRKLVDILLGHLRADGVKEVWLGTDVDNVEAHALYRATGAVSSGETFNDCTYYLT
jgi:ribosomal protein S18 acetylase RimI-like enzyme